MGDSINSHNPETPEELERLEAGDKQTDDVAEFEAELAGACKRCLGKGQVEVMGDGANFEWDVIGYKVCGDCNGTGLKQ